LKDNDVIFFTYSIPISWTNTWCQRLCGDTVISWTMLAEFVGFFLLDHFCFRASSMFAMSVVVVHWCIAIMNQ